MNRASRSRLAPPPLGRAALLAALAVALSPAGASAQDPAELVEAAIPHDSAISEQYQRVQEVLDKAAAVVPDAPLAPPVAESEPAPAATPAPAPPAPEPPPPKQQYHSETPSNVSVTQQQPSNVNVSIRINSPGDDGPVVQINNAGGTTQVEQIIERAAPPQPEPAAPPTGGDLPDTWEWVWTSACFGGAPGASAAAARPGWSWRWSCGEAGEPGGDDVLAGLPGMPDAGVPDVDEFVAAAGPSFAEISPAAAAAPERPRSRPDLRARTGPLSGGNGRAGPPPARGTPAAQPLVAGASAHAPPAAADRNRHAPRAAAEASPGPGDDGASSNLPPGGGPGLGAATALGSMASILLGIWTAVLATACVLVIPRLRHRRWSGLTRRLTRLPSLRLERPG